MFGVKRPNLQLSNRSLSNGLLAPHTMHWGLPSWGWGPGAGVLLLVPEASRALPASLPCTGPCPCSLGGLSGVPCPSELGCGCSMQRFSMRNDFCDARALCVDELLVLADSQKAEKPCFTDEGTEAQRGMRLSPRLSPFRAWVIRGPRHAGGGGPNLCVFTWSHAPALEPPWPLPACGTLHSGPGGTWQSPPRLLPQPCLTPVTYMP